MTTSKHFSIDLKLDSKTQTALASISKSLETIAQNMTSAKHVSYMGSNIPADEPSELGVNIPIDLIEKPAKHFTVVRTTSSKGVIWNRITGHQRLMWRDDGDWISLRYNESAVKTKWPEVKRLSKIPKNRRRMEIQRMLSTKDIDRITAVSVFVSSYLEGLVEAPEEPDEIKEDPDAAFRLMVTPFVSTRPDENCGSIESLQGAY